MSSDESSRLRISTVSGSRFTSVKTGNDDALISLFRALSNAMNWRNISAIFSTKMRRLLAHPSCRFSRFDFQPTIRQSDFHSHTLS